MRATGIIRRMDDLGRVVIPKEIRKSLNIREGDPLEIYTDQNIIGLKKYQPIGVLDISTTKKLCDKLLGNLNYTIYDSEGIAILPKNSVVKLDLSSLSLQDTTITPIIIDGETIGYVHSPSGNRTIAAEALSALLEE